MAGEGEGNSHCSPMGHCTGFQLLSIHSLLVSCSDWDYSHLPLLPEGWKSKPGSFLASQQHLGKNQGFKTLQTRLGARDSDLHTHSKALLSLQAAGTLELPRLSLLSSSSLALPNCSCSAQRSACSSPGSSRCSPDFSCLAGRAVLRHSLKYF